MAWLNGRYGRYLICASRYAGYCYERNENEKVNWLFHVSEYIFGEIIGLEGVKIKKRLGLIVGVKI